MAKPTEPQWSVDARGAQGVQVGDDYSQHIHLHPREITWPVRAGLGFSPGAKR
jgi:hypothetical protein